MHFLARSVSSWIVGFVSLISGVHLTAADPTPVNPDTSAYDHHPDAALADGGAMWIAWHAYRDGRDRILVRRLSSAGVLGDVEEVSEKGRTHGPPALAVDGDAIHVFWSSHVDGRWIVKHRVRRDGVWERIRRVSGENEAATACRAARLGAGRLLVVWSGQRAGAFQIRGRVIDQGEPQPVLNISEPSVDAYRPCPVVDGGQVWVFWDQYAKQNYSVHGRRILPGMAPIERISPAGEYCLKPAAVAHADRLCVAWLRKVDVIGGPGAVSQWHSLHAAERQGGQWKMVTDAQGGSAGAELTQGLMAQIEPRPVATSGYLGQRTQPMLLADEGRTWLMWERKADHRGSTASITGDLAGRPFAEGRWQAPVSFCSSHVDYHLVHPHAGPKGSTTLLASRLPRKGKRIYERFELDLANARDFQQEAWTGWTPVDLPMKGEMTERFSIKANGRTYQLYWADLHCHNNLSADAEGEPDELMHYARIAQLDVVVFTNNDFYLAPLTQYEYEFGNLLARVASRPGFLALPGFEWTSRIPGNRSGRLDDPGNWLPPYQNSSYPNHRSVIYPSSGGPLLHFPEAGNQISQLNAAVQKAGGITLTQHAAFQISKHPVEVGMELTSGWGNYIARRPNLFHGPLQRGLRLGFVANGDTHRRAPGLSGALTAVYAEKLTSEAILDALRKRRCFATNGSRIRVDARANGALMGEEVRVSTDGVALQLKAVGTRPITRATLIRDGEEIYSAAGNGKREFKVRYQDTNLTEGTHWYYWRIAQDRAAPALPGNLMAAHGALAWSTPHWVAVPR